MMRPKDLEFEEPRLLQPGVRMSDQLIMEEGSSLVELGEEYEENETLTFQLMEQRTKDVEEFKGELSVENS
jgi:hypothetical protein